MEEEVYIDFANNQAPAINDTNLNQLQKLIKQDFKEQLKLMFPVGSRYVTQTNTNPNTILKFGTWERLKGKVCLGLDEDDDDLDTIGKTGGEKEHTLTIDEMPSHSHGNLPDMSINDGHTDGIFGYKSSGALSNRTSDTGGSQPHNNMQPYEIVGYMWIRRS